jgi:phage I-like protein
MTKNATHYLALNFELPPSTDAALPDWLLLIPAGQVVGRDGRSWINDQAEQAVAYNRAQNRDVPVDIEHATELKAPKGEPAPAVGWIKEFDARDGAIWGRVEWNDDGKALLSGHRYRYYSPAFRADRNDRVSGLSSVGLTNKANLAELPALNHQSTEREGDMPLSEAIRQALSLKDDANDADAVLAIGKLKDEHRTALNAESQAKANLVPRADFDLVVTQRDQYKTELNSERQTHRDAQINSLIDEAIEQKKIASLAASLPSAAMPRASA